jgi:hypothetical protein
LIFDQKFGVTNDIDKKFPPMAGAENEKLEIGHVLLQRFRRSQPFAEGVNPEARDRADAEQPSIDMHH